MLEGKQQFKPVKKTGMMETLEKMGRGGLLPLWEVDRLMTDNESKYERLHKYGLPTFFTWGPTESFEETAKLIPDSWKEIPKTLEIPARRFLVRCAPKNLHSALKIERTMNITWPEVATFIKQLPGGKENYTVEIREHGNADYAGTIIANGKGKIMTEISSGNLAEQENKGISDIKNARIDLSDGVDIHIKYSENSSEFEKNIILGALKYFTPELSRKNLEELKIYTEFSYSKEQGYRFFEVTTDDFWTNLGMPLSQ